MSQASVGSTVLPPTHTDCCVTI